MKTIFQTFLIFFGLSCLIEKIHAQVTSSSTINVSSAIMPESQLLFGITMDARSGMTGNNGQIGYFNTDGTLLPEVDSLFNDFPVHSLRYPANGILFGFDWKKSIGLPANSRPTQNLLGSLGPAQSMEFGFDEFMAWTSSKGVTPANVHIMVPIYDADTIWSGQIQQMQAITNVIQHCADWVEYANAPNDGSNPGGGIDWAAVRATNGHPNPYGIELWNMGNEPWSSNEFGSGVAGCNQYLNIITPIIDAMLAIDPTIKITLATVGTNVGPNTWHYAILNSSLVASGKVYGLSPHAFPVESGTNTKVSNFVSVYTSLAANCQTKGLKMILGDYARGIPQLPPSQSEQDLAMQWEGSILSVDFLLGMSKINNLERVNFWVYGMPTAQWHPIRYYNGVYTLMPVAQLYKKLYPLVLDHSISTSNTSDGGSDGNPYGVNSSAFASVDLSAVNLLSVNRDVIDTNEFQVTPLTGYTLQQASLITAASPTAETFTETPILPDANGNYILPPMSILILQYAVISSQPSIAGLSNTVLCQDQVLTISGSNLVNISSVTVGGTSVSFNPVSSTSLDITFTTTVSGLIQIVTGSGTAISNQAITVSALPTVTISANGSTTFCQGGSVDLSSNYTTGNTWSDGALSQNLTASSAGTYSVTVIDGNGCTNTSNTILVSVNPLPDANVMTGQGTISAVNANATYQWMDCTSGLQILGANSQSYSPSYSGDYAVILTENSCVDSSVCTTIILSNAAVLQEVINPLRVYPNPVTNLLYFSQPFSNFKIINLMGQEVYQSGEAVSQFDASSISDGIYYLQTQPDIRIKFEVRHTF